MYIANLTADSLSRLERTKSLASALLALLASWLAAAVARNMLGSVILVF